MSRPSAVLAAALAALLPAESVFACIHGAKTVSVMTGKLETSRREEKLVAKLNPGSTVAVKLFVGPPNAKIEALQLSAATLAAHKDLAAIGNAILQDEARPVMRGGGTARSIGAPQEVASLTTNNGVVVKVEKLPGYRWADIVQHLKFADDPDHAASMDVWTQKVHKAGRAIYVAKVDLTNAAQAGRDDALGVGVSITYGASGDRLRQEIVTDKWLEYLGSPKVATMFRTAYPEDKLIADFATIAQADGLMVGGLPQDKAGSAYAEPNAGGNGQDLTLQGIPERNGRKLTSITVKGGDIFFKNESLKLTDRSLQASLAAAGGPANTERSIRLPTQVPVIQGPFGN